MIERFHALGAADKYAVISHFFNIINLQPMIPSIGQQPGRVLNCI